MMIAQKTIWTCKKCGFVHQDKIHPFKCDGKSVERVWFQKDDIRNEYIELIKLIQQEKIRKLADRIYYFHNKFLVNNCPLASDDDKAKKGDEK